MYSVLYDEELGRFRYRGCISDETRVSKERGKDEFALRQNFYFAGDSVDHRMGWKDQASLDSLKGTSIRLHFWMQEAELYSFWFERDG